MTDVVVPGTPVAPWARFNGKPLADVVSRLFVELALKRVGDDLEVLLREPPPETLLLEVAGRLATGPRTEAELGAFARHAVRPWFEAASNRDRLREVVRAVVGLALGSAFWTDFHGLTIQASVVDPAIDPLRRYPLRSAAWDKISGQLLAILQARCEERRENWFRDAAYPLVVALAEGAIGVSGAREPVRDRDETPEPVPFGVLEDRRWRLQRDQSRLIALDTAGISQDAFKHAVLVVRVEEATRAPAMARQVPETMEHSNPEPESPPHQNYEADPVAFVKRVMLDLPGGLETGSKATALEVRRRHGENIDTIARLKLHADAARGAKLPPKRPVGATKRPPKPRR